MLSVFEDVTDVKFSQTPGAKTSDRGSGMKQGTGEFCWSPAGDLWYAMYGIEDFAALGPQSARMVYHGGQSQQGFGVRGDSGIKTRDDLIGKRVASYPTYALVQLYMTSKLAYFDLTYDDVIATPVSSFGAGQSAVLEGACDAAIFSNSSVAQELAASIHGIAFIPTPNVTAEDKEGWARHNELNRFQWPDTTTILPGTADNPLATWAHSRIIWAYDSTDADLVYWFTKIIHENWDGYKGLHGNLLLYTEAQALNSDAWFVPMHEGSIRYWKDLGLWTPKMQAKQTQMLVDFPQKLTQ